MKKSVKTQNETTLESVVTARAKQEANRLGVALPSYIASIATKADRLPMTIEVRVDDIVRISKIAKGGRVREWVESVVVDVLECEEGEAAELAAKN